MKLSQMVHSIDIHVAGEAFRLIKDTPLIRAKHLEAYAQAFFQQHKGLVQLLLREPRGMAALTGCLVIPAYDANADFAFLCFDYEGHTKRMPTGAMAIITALLETGAITQKETGLYHIETLSGVIAVKAELKDDAVTQVEMEISDTTADLAVFSVEEEDLQLSLDNLTELKNWAKKQLENGEDQAIALMEKTSQQSVRSITFLPDGSILRSPGIVTTIAAANNSGYERIMNESIYGGYLHAEKKANKWRIIARPFITGSHAFVLDPTDPLAEGFLLT